MTRNLKVSLLIASTFVVLGATSSQACCYRRRGCQPTQSYCQSGYGYASPTGYYSSGQGGYGTTGGGMAAATAGYPAVRPARLRPARLGYDFGRPGYNPGGLGGPASGLGVRPGLGVGGFGPGR